MVVLYSPGTCAHYIIASLWSHNPTILVRKQNANLKVAKQCHYTIIFRPLKKVDVCNLINDLNELPWSVLDTFENNVDNACIFYS